MPLIDPNQFWAEAMGAGSHLYDTLRNSALGYAVQQTMPRVADALNFYPTVTRYSPDYQAAQRNLVNPQFMIPPGVAARHPNAARARGALTAIGNQTSGANMAMLAAAGMGFGALPELAEGTRLAPYVPSLLKGIGVAGLGAGAIQQMKNAPPASNPEARGQMAADLGLAALGTHMLLQPEAAATAAADFWGQATGHPTVAPGEAFRPNKPYVDATGNVVWPEQYLNPPAGGGGNYTADDLAALKAKHGIGPTPGVSNFEPPAQSEASQRMLAGLNGVALDPLQVERMRMSGQEPVNAQLTHNQQPNLIDQIVAAHNENGGSTFHPTQGNLFGQDRFSVSMFPELTRTVTGDLKPEHIDDFIGQNAAILQQNPQLAVGTWRNGEGNHVLDIVGTTNDLNVAHQLGRKYNQQAIFDLLHGREIPTGGTGEAVPSLPPINQRAAELSNPADPLNLLHWSTVPNLDTLDASRFGSSTVSGAERARANEPNFLPRTYAGIPGQYYEPRITNRPFTYSGQVNGGRYYDIENDPLGIWQKAYQQGGPTAAENAVREAGFSGYRGHGAVASFDNVPVKPTQNPLGQKPRSGERGSVNLDLLLSPSLAARLFGDTSFNPEGDVSKSLGAKPGFMAKRNGKLTGESGVLRSLGFEQPDAPTFYHKSEQVAKDKLPNAAPGDAMLATLRNNGVKDSEIKWLGLDDFLQGKPKVMKSDLMNYIQAHKVNLEEVNRTDTSAFNQRQADVQINRDAAVANFREATVRHLSHNFYPGSPRSLAGMVANQHLLRNDIPLENILQPGVYGGIKPSDEMVRYAQEARRLSLENAEMERNAPKSARYNEYTLDGPKENYTEKLMTLPARPSWKTVEPAPEIVKKYESQWNDLIARQEDARNRREQFYDTNHTELVKATNDLNHAKLEQEILHSRMVNETVMSQGGTKAINNYHSPHWDEMNVLAHIRHSDRIDAEGKKNLFIEEIQSDWHQAGRKKGYQTFQVPDTSKWTVKTLQPVNEYTGQRSVAILDENGNTVTTRYNTREPDAAIMASAEDARIRANMIGANQVPEAPFKNNWHELAFKRMIREAAEKGYDRLSWTTGQQQADRYNLATRIRALHSYKNADGTYNLKATLPDGNERDVAGSLRENQLEEYVGRDLADKIKAAHAQETLLDQGDKPWKTFKGVDLTVGGEGMKGFYDKILPDFANKYAKKWGAKVGTTDIRTGEGNNMPDKAPGALVAVPEHAATKVHSIDITPEMKRSVMKEGQPISQLRGAPSFWQAATGSQG